MIPNKPIDIEEKALEIYSTIYDAIDDLGASECINEDKTIRDIIQASRGLDGRHDK